jgi:two-component system OmpR family response regulator
MNSTEQLSIFLVDDDPMFTMALENQLEQKFKAKYSKFSTGEECLKNLDQNPKIVVLDYFLNSESPDAMNGIEVLKEIKSNIPEAMVIILSAQDKMGVAMNAIKSGALDYIIKNENAFLRIQNAIKNAMDRISLHDNIKEYRFRAKLFVIAAIIVAVIFFIVRIYYLKT